MNSYKELALYDLKKARANYAYELWNGVGRECQQVCEKYLKHYLQKQHLLTKELGRTHNLKKLLRAIPNYNEHLYKDMSLVGDYYFETTYPGDNFIELDQEMADEALAIAGKLIDYVESL